MVEVNVHSSRRFRVDDFVCQECVAPSAAERTAEYLNNVLFSAENPPLESRKPARVQRPARMCSG